MQNDRRPNPVRVTPMRIVIIGAGGFGREVLDIVEALATSADLECAGYVDDGDVQLAVLARRGVALLGVTDDVPRLGLPYVVGIGSGAVRGRIVARLDATGCTAITLVHPAATVGGDVRVAEGVIIAAGARVTTNVDLGRHVDLHVNCTVGHDTVIEEFASVYPGATVSGNVHIGRTATIGTGANVLPGIRVGAGSFVGAGAVVTKDVAPGVTVVGSPARPLST